VHPQGISPGSVEGNPERKDIMSHKQSYEATDLNYGSDSFTTFERVKPSKRQRPAMGRQRGKVPQSFNGIHRRRRRKICW
jgi:hypothetical protein